MSTIATVRNALRQALGAEHVLTSGDLQSYERDWRGRSSGKALAVVQPTCAAEVAAVVRICSAYGVAMVPQGGNTGLALGSTPDASGTEVVISTRRMQQVRAIDKANLTLTADAGCVLQTLHETAARDGLLLPLSLASKGSCTLGGNLSTNAGGTQVLHYGNARELCLGLEVVAVQGEVWNGLSGLRKDNTGYALRDLFIGSEGTLGIITAATMKLQPLPAARLTAWAPLPSLKAAVGLLGLARSQLGPALTGFEVMNQPSLELVAQYFPQLQMPPWQQSAWCALLECSDHEDEAHARMLFERLLQEALEREYTHDPVLSENLRQAQSLWEIRESIPLAEARAGLAAKHDISVPISRIPAFVTETDTLLQADLSGVRLINFGHLGDGNLHYNVRAPVHQDAMQFLQRHEKRINAIVFDSVARHGGSISAEHGIGALKAETLLTYKSPVALSLMRAIKQALDPKGVMNPGRVLTLPPRQQ